jgi:hypothetical protein
MKNTNPTKKVGQVLSRQSMKKIAGGREYGSSGGKAFASYYAGWENPS